MNAWLEKGVTPATSVLESIDRIPFFLTLATVLFFYPRRTLSTTPLANTVVPLFRSCSFHLVVLPYTQKTMHMNSDRQSYFQVFNCFQLLLIYDIIILPSCAGYVLMCYNYDGIRSGKSTLGNPGIKLCHGWWCRGAYILFKIPKCEIRFSRFAGQSRYLYHNK